MGHYASERESTPEEDAAYQKRQAAEAALLTQSEAFIASDIAARGVAAVLADIIASAPNYRDRTLRKSST